MAEPQQSGGSGSNGVTLAASSARIEFFRGATDTTQRIVNATLCGDSTQNCLTDVSAAQPRFRRR